MKKIILVLLIASPFFLYAQNRNSIWCFGDSSGIDFSSGTPVAFNTSVDSRGSCVSMANDNGTILFYAATMGSYAPNNEMGTFVFNANHNVMSNGDSIVGFSWYQELIVVPNPADDSTYYLFSISITGNYGITYSIIDMKQNGGLGDVVLKNSMLQSFKQVDCINAIKHGNGRDWWLLFRKSDAPTFSSNNDWYSYLITPNGIQNYSLQSIGSLNRTGGAHTCFSPLGDKLLFTNWVGLIELFDFDRCTGQLSNPITIQSDPGNPPYPLTWSSAFSPDASKVYVTSNEDTSFVYQYDLSAANISASKDTIWTTSFPTYACGSLVLAPDNKIYLSSLYYNGLVYPYPYQDSVYNMYNMNLSVINDPDSLGSDCNFQPYSFYLGGKRTYLGLPNNPYYDLGPLIGSPCDTITGINQANESTPEFFIYYEPNWQTAFINAQKLKGKEFSLQVFDVLGKLVFKEEGKLSSQYFTMNLNCSSFSKGLYVLTLQTDKEKLVKKFVKE